MPKQKIESLMTELHELFGDSQPSEEQQRLLEQLREHMHSIDTAEPIDPSPLDTLELLISRVGADHPKTHAVLRELMNTLKNIGV